MDLTAEVSRLRDIDAIRRVLYTYCRGIDRGDESVFVDVFHDDAYADYGTTKGRALDWIHNQAMPARRGMTFTQHFVGNLIIDLDGDVAQSEAYFQASHRSTHDGAEVDFFVFGRYLDRHERRAGTWRIAHRRVVVDWSRWEPAGSFFASHDAFLGGTLAPDDPLYAPT